MSKYAVSCQHLHESDLYHQHSNCRFLRHNCDKKHQLSQTGVSPHPPTHLAVWWTSNTAAECGWRTSSWSCVRSSTCPLGIWCEIESSRAVDVVAGISHVDKSNTPPSWCAITIIIHANHGGHDWCWDCVCNYWGNKLIELIFCSLSFLHWRALPNITSFKCPDGISCLHLIRW